MNNKEVVLLHSLSVEDLVEINDFFNSAEKITVIYTDTDVVICELHDNGLSEDFYLTRRELVMILKDFYVHDICEIVHSAVNSFIKIKINQIEDDYPVQITTGNGTRYFYNERELNYIKKLIDSQKRNVLS